MASLIPSSKLLGNLVQSILKVQAKCSFATTAAVQRWHKDQVDNRRAYRFGYRDRVKKIGKLPRLEDNSPIMQAQPVFRPRDPFAPRTVLKGQNDYIDILGSDEVHPIHAHYHLPNWLRGKEFAGYTITHPMNIYKKNTFEESGMPMAQPKRWETLCKDTGRMHNYYSKRVQQKSFINYKGPKYGSVPNPYTSKYPF